MIGIYILEISFLVLRNRKLSSNARHAAKLVESILLLTFRNEIVSQKLVMQSFVYVCEIGGKMVHWGTDSFMAIL